MSLVFFKTQNNCIQLSQIVSYFQINTTVVDKKQIEETAKVLKVITSGVTLTKNETEEAAEVVKVIGNVAESSNVQVNSRKYVTVRLSKNRISS